jgi:hypothetical protein
LRNIHAGEELSYDYGLIIDAPYTKKLKAEYPCWCGAAGCRGTLLTGDGKKEKKSKKNSKGKGKGKSKKAKDKKGGKSQGRAREASLPAPAH